MKPTAANLPAEPRQLSMALDARTLRGLTPSQRAEVLIALAMLLREAAEGARQDERR